MLAGLVVRCVPIERDIGEKRHNLGLARASGFLENLAERRCLLVLDAPIEPLRSALTAFGRSSTLVTTEPVETLSQPHTFAYAMTLIAANRLAEAYELLYKLLEDSVEASFCARELAWICEEWDRPAEAARLRQFDPAPSRQVGLFE